jgi:hypothetical protein
MGVGMSAAQHEPDLTPTVAEVQQEEIPPRLLDPVPVVVVDPVRVQIVPLRTTVARSITLTTSPEIILPANPRRARAVLLPAAAIRWGTREDIDQDAGFKQPANTTVTVKSADVIWARSDTSTAVTSILVEEWSL